MLRLAKSNRIRLCAPGRLALATGAPGAPRLKPADSLTIDESAYMDRHVFQRIAGARQVPISLTYTGTPDQLSARVVDDVTGSTVVDWTTIATSPTTGSVSTNITVPQGGLCRLQVTDGTTIWSAVKRFAVGARIATIGQSNMFFLAAIGTGSKYPLGSTETLGWGDTNSGGTNYVLARLGNIATSGSYPPDTEFATYGNYTTDTGAFTGDGIVHLANRLVSQYGCAVLIAHFAVTGSAIEKWISGGSCWTRFTSGLGQIGNELEAALWLQGEENTQSSTISDYKTKLGQVLSNLWALVGRDASNFKFGVTCLGPATSYYGAEGNGGKIRQAHLEFVAENAANSVFLNSTAHDTNLAGGDVHFDKPSQARQGYRYAQALLAPGSMDGPKISGATWSGNTVTVSVTHASGTALLDGAGGAGGALLGFRVFDNGVAATISATAISGNTIVLTLGAAPAGPVTLDYCMTNAPFGGTTDPASVVYDNYSYHGGTTGCPLQPKPAFTVTAV